MANLIGSLMLRVNFLQSEVVEVCRTVSICRDLHATTFENVSIFQQPIGCNDLLRFMQQNFCSQVSVCNTWILHVFWNFFCQLKTALFIASNRCAWRWSDKNQFDKIENVTSNWSELSTVPRHIKVHVFGICSEKALNWRKVRWSLNREWIVIDTLPKSKAAVKRWGQNCATQAVRMLDQKKIVFQGKIKISVSLFRLVLFSFCFMHHGQ